MILSRFFLHNYWRDVFHTNLDCPPVVCIYGKSGLVKGVIGSAPYLIIAVVARLVMDQVKSLEYWKLLICVLLAIALGYVLFKRDCKKDEEAEKASQ